ncbi:MAG: methionyl-tRNA formyltransferase [Oscillospiraceae bacterium]|nr:methionyl-tRNA formyltransferase [Oscillospiraceae bacterium]
MKLVFMGTPDFAVPCLSALVESGAEVAAVFTQPDKPSGRKYKLVPTPVKKKAMEYGIPVYQPLSLRKGEDAEESMRILQEINPDCIVVAAYGQILPKSILELPKYGCVNVHASLLPRYRGAAPIQRCILEGETETGVTIMQMAEGLDTGDMLLKGSLPIGETETASELHDRLSALGAELITKALQEIKDGTITPEVQDDALSCYAAMITKDMSALDFTKPAAQLHRTICALSGFTTLEGKRFKAFRSRIGENKDAAAAGTILDPQTLLVQCGEGTTLYLTEVQTEGGKRLSTSDFVRGKKISAGQRFGE